MHVAVQFDSEGATVDLAVWIPLTLALGALTLLLLLAFIEACDRV